MARKGCDASNIYDEEIPEKDQEFSDDDLEKQAKKKRKKKRTKPGCAESSSSEADDEEGEIKPKGNQAGRGRGGHQSGGPKRFNRGGGTSIPMYSATIPVN